MARIMIISKMDLKRLKRLTRLTTTDLLGIEIEKNRFKLVHLNISATHTQILHLVHKDIAGLNDSDISKTIHSIVFSLSFKQPQLISVVNPSSVITKNIEIPSVDPQEIKEIISLQAGRHTPYSREEIIVDYINLGVYRRNYTRILLVIVNRSIIKKQLDILNKAGLNPQHIVFSSEAIALSTATLFKIDTENNFYGIIHIDEEGTDFMIVSSLRPIFIRHIPVGAKQLVFEKEKYQLRFLEEIRRSQEVYLAEDIGKSPHSYILTGSIEALTGLEQVLDMPIQKVDYLRDLTLSEGILKDISFSKNISFLNIVSSLLCLDKVKVDLVPEEVKLKRTLQIRAKYLLKSAILILTIFVLLFFILLSKIYFKSIYLKNLDRKYKALMLEAKELEEDFSHLSIVKNYVLRRGYSLEVLAEIYTILPKEIELSDIRYEEQGKFSLRGSASSMSLVFSLVDNLEKSEYFKEVKTRYTTKRKSGTKDVTDFEIICSLEKPS